MKITDVTDYYICDLLAEEKSFKEIAIRLGWSIARVMERFNAICNKLGDQAK